MNATLTSRMLEDGIPGGNADVARRQEIDSTSVDSGVHCGDDGLAAALDPVHALLGLADREAKVLPLTAFLPGRKMVASSLRSVPT